MLAMSYVALVALLSVFPFVAGHASIFHPSMFGFNITDQTFPYDNRPVSPLVDLSFDQWWFHGHLDYPPNTGDFFELPAGKAATTEIACHKGHTSYWESSEGGTDIRNGDHPCPRDTDKEEWDVIHTTGPNDTTGCALAIAYKPNARDVQPEDFTVFSVNHSCVFHRFTDFQVPARMPSCPEGGCVCAWFWIHSPDSGSEQNYMTGFNCNVTGATSTVALAKPQIPRRCGADEANGVKEATPGNCTYGAKQPFYWFQRERNNMFEGTYAPPFYTDLYNFEDGAQEDIFVDSYAVLPEPSPDNTFIPTPLMPSSNSSTSTSSNTQPGTGGNSTTPNDGNSTPPGDSRRSRICRANKNDNTTQIQRRSGISRYRSVRQNKPISLLYSRRGFSLWHPF